MVDDERSAGAKYFLGKDGAGLCQIDKIHGESQLFGEFTGEVETSQWSNGIGGKEGEVKVTLGVLSRPAERAEEIDDSRIKRSQGADDLGTLFWGKLGHPAGRLEIKTGKLVLPRRREGR